MLNWPWWAYLILVLLGLEAFVIAFFIRRTFKRKAQAERQEAFIRTTGEPGTALVVEITDTGERSESESYLFVKLRLQVTPSISAPFHTTIDARISPVRLADFAEGKQIAVRIEPGTQVVVIDQRVQ